MVGVTSSTGVESDAVAHKAMEHEVEVAPKPDGRWVLSWAGRPLSFHPDAKSAERAASAVAHEHGVHEAIVRDRYHRLHRIVV